MSDLISKKALLKTMNEHEQGWRKHGEQGELTSYAVGLGLRIAMEAIYEQPTVDAVEVVKCKDCKHRNTENCGMWYECGCGSQYSWEYDDGFCSWGAKMDEEGDSSE